MEASRESEARDGAAGEDNLLERIIGEYGSGGGGPLLIITAGVHGNEPAGVAAARRVFERLRRGRTAVDGRVVGLAGNLPALARGVRFIDRDLNRMWFAERVERLEATEPSHDSTEERQQRELLHGIEDVLAGHGGAVTLLDLHSTSAESPPFCIIGDTLQNRRMAFAWSIPVILGLEEAVAGTIDDYFGEMGYVTASLEGGRHDQPATVDCLESALWIAMVTAGLLREDRVPDIERHRERLRDATRGLPSVIEVVHRHGISPRDGFRMKSGFGNFSPVERGQSIAHDRHGDVLAETRGLLVMPSYQRVGGDGFFIGRRVRRFWLGLSTGVRRLGLDPLIPLLPGVRRHPSDDRAVLADPRPPRWLVRKVFHLFGFRECPPENGLRVFRRRLEGRRS